MLDETLVRAFITLMVAVAAIALLMVYLKRKVAKGKIAGSTLAIQVVARQALNPKAQIYIVSIAGKTVMLGVTEQSVTNLGELAVSAQAQAQTQAQTQAQFQPQTQPQAHHTTTSTATVIPSNVGQSVLANIPAQVAYQSHQATATQQPLPQQPTFGNFLRSIVRRAA